MININPKVKVNSNKVKGNSDIKNGDENVFDVDVDGIEEEVDDYTEEDMMGLMGFSGFDSSKVRLINNFI